MLEDNTINQTVLCRIFKWHGVNYTVTNNGQEAVDNIKSGTDTYQICLMDIRMPVKDGYSATYEIREWEALRIRKADDTNVAHLNSLSLEENSPNSIHNNYAPQKTNSEQNGITEIQITDD